MKTALGGLKLASATTIRVTWCGTADILANNVRRETLINWIARISSQKTVRNGLQLIFANEIPGWQNIAGFPANSVEIKHSLSWRVSVYHSNTCHSNLNITEKFPVFKFWKWTKLPFSIYPLLVQTALLRSTKEHANLTLTIWGPFVTIRFVVSSTSALKLLKSRSNFVLIWIENENRCTDKDKANCPSWAFKGDCEKNPELMNNNCNASCNVKCCEDNHTDCGLWASKGQCVLKPAELLINCKRSCRNCEICKDIDTGECKKKAEMGECTKTPHYMTLYCPKSCKVCG